MVNTKRINTKWRFQKWLMKILQNNTVKCKKLANGFSGPKIVACVFVRRK